MASKKGETVEHKRLELHDQILLRPDTYIGSVQQILYPEPIWIYRNGIIQRSRIKLSEGLIQMFGEIISNSIDNVWRSYERKIPCSSIKVNIEQETGKISVWNDGNPIPVKLHPDEKMYIPELIFGCLLTSSNYDDSKERKTVGRNGYGSKISNIFSSVFEIEIFDHINEKIYKQKWEKNMKKKYPPKITDRKTKFKGVSGGYTKVSWIPDFPRLGVSQYDADSLDLIKKKVYDTAMICSEYGVKVFLNDEEIPVKTLKDYSLSYFKNPPEEVLSMKSKDCEVVLVPFKEFVQVSFVNGTLTSEGGVHVDAWTEAVFRPIVDKINGVKKSKTTEGDEKKTKKRKEKEEKSEKKKKDKKRPNITIKDVKQYFAVFLNCSLDKPKFTSQTKTKLTGPDVEVNVRKADIDKLMKWDFVQKIENALKFKSLETLDKMGKKRGFGGKIIHANFVRDSRKKKERQNCILCVSEGDSAAAYLSGGIEYGILGRKGHDYIGIFPLRGKFLNVRNSSTTTISKNKEVEALVEGLGLQGETDYTDEENRKNLRYGKLLVCADSDVDGIHIVGLLYNFFHTLYPSLLKVPGFFNFLRTPIVKVTHGDKVLPFYYLQQAHKFIEKHHIKNTAQKQLIQYFKGLGSTSDRSLKEDFAKNKVVQLELDGEGDDIVDKVFNKIHAEFRKEWITSYEESNRELKETKTQLETLPVTEFFNAEMRTFSIEDCERSIPNLEDGLKQSQRKILYSGFQRKLKFTGKSIKVSRFTQWAAGDTNYHHGESGLDDTLIKLVQRFVGSNNIPLFYDDGNFGSRLKNGDDAAAGRYPFTKMDCLTRYIFPEDDDRFLDNIYEEGMKIEKKSYVPIIPMILVNGCMGIGTGYSSTVPQYNPLDLVKWIGTWLKCDGKIKTEMNGLTISEVEELTPWWRGFQGTVKVNNKKVNTYGVVKVVDEEKKRYEVSELPIGKKNISIVKFKEMLDEMVDEKKIDNYKMYGTNNIVKFLVDGNDSMDINVDTLGLTDCIHTSNMVLFSSDHKLKKYDNVDDDSIGIFKRCFGLGMYV